LKKIIVVGGGTAGYTTALILKTRFPTKEIEIVKSDKIGIIGVGEGTTEHFSDFMQFCGITFKDLIKNCDTTLKGGVMFHDWGKDNYIHSPEMNLGALNVGKENVGYLSQIANNKNKFEMSGWGAVNSKLPVSTDCCKINQYHFNTFKLNDYLHKIAIEKGIKVSIDDIEEIKINSEGNIESIEGKEKYNADFFIDCTGFRRLLIKEMGAKWISYSKYLKMNSAIAFQTPDTDEYNMWTLAKAMKYGWMWRIPTYGRWGNGYVFDDNYITFEQAKEEVEQVLGHSIEVRKEIKFDSGKIDKPWINNCVAIGLSSNFVEPLEATAISTGIQQTILLTRYIEEFDNQSIIDYNYKVDCILNNIRDYICLHYITDRDDTDFWKDLKNVDIPESLSTNLLRWSKRLPIGEDFTETSYILFGHLNFIQVMYGLNLFDVSKMKKQYDSWGEPFKKQVEEIIKERITATNNIEYIGHKEWLTKVRSEND